MKDESKVRRTYGQRKKKVIDVRKGKRINEEGGTMGVKIISIK